VGPSGRTVTRLAVPHSDKFSEKTEKSGVFFVAKKCASKHHVNDAFHHELTIKLPPKITIFFAKPPAKQEIRPAKKKAQSNSQFLGHVFHEASEFRQLLPTRP